MKQALFTYIKNEDIRQKNGKSAQRTVERLYVNNIMKKWTVTTIRFPNNFGIQQKKAGPSAWMCTTSYFPNAL